MGTESTKLAILKATIDVIEGRGLQAVTLRDISARAGVNLAAINYHFGSKAKLLDQALGLTLRNSFEHIEANLASSEPLMMRLEKLLLYILWGAHEFPNITRAHLYQPVTFGDCDVPYLRKLNAIVAECLDREELSPERREALDEGLALAIASVHMVGLAPNMLSAATGLDERIPETRARYAAKLMGLMRPAP